jgi:fumarate reductase flavoprotein subunit
MRKRRGVFAAMAVATAVSMLAAGCSQGTGSTVESTTETTATTASAETTSASSDSAETGYKAGTYTATAQGNNGDVTVEVVFSDSAIESVVVKEHGETAGISDGALEKIPAEITSQQSLNIDAVTGATNTSKAILAAVEDCVNQAGGDAQALLTKAAAEKQGVDEEMTTQIVVVGGGASGTAAALQAAQSGSDVVVVEMTAAPAGQGTMAGGLFATYSTQQMEAGEQCDNSWIYDQFVTTGNYQVNGGLLSKIIQMSGSTVDWLIENGCKLTLTHAGSGSYLDHTSQPFDTLHGYTEGGTAGITALHASIVENGGTILYNTKATELIMEEGKAAGIKCEKEDGGILTIHADAVILATGGFGGNEEKVEETFGEGFGVSRVATNIGTGIEMAISAGADASYDKAITMHYGLSRGGTAWTTALNSALLNPYLHVDVDGNRFMNEEMFIFEPIKSSNVIKSLPQRKAYELFDSTMIDIVKEQGYAGITDLFAGELAEDPTLFVEVGNTVDTGKRYEDSHTPTDIMPAIEDAIAAGKIVTAESPEEMAEKLGMTHLAETIERYNELCDQGEDTDQFKSSKYLDKLEGTLYAVEITPSVFLGTLGGVEINQNCEVINSDGKAIPGLYAAGSDTSGVYGNTYVYFEGGTLGYAYNSGRLAGTSASEFVK